MNARADGYGLDKEQDIGIVSEDVPIKYLLREKMVTLQWRKLAGTKLVIKVSITNGGTGHHQVPSDQRNEKNIESFLYYSCQGFLAWIWTWGNIKWTYFKRELTQGKALLFNTVKVMKDKGGLGNYSSWRKLKRHEKKKLVTMILDWILNQKGKRRQEIARKVSEIWMSFVVYKVMLYQC